MIPFLLRRVLSAVPTLVGIALLTFLVLNILPGDPLLVWSGGGYYSAESVEHLRSELRLEQGPAARFASWGMALLRGDLGRSMRDGRPVTAVVAAALPWSLLLNAGAVLLIYGLAVPFGLLGAAAPGSATDRLGRTLLLLLYGVPSFAAALLLQQCFAVRLRWLPLQGLPDPAGRAAAPLAALVAHLALPTL